MSLLSPSRPFHFRAIAAMSENRVIGRGASIPWHLPEDFKWFKQRTMGSVLLMGRKTFESIGRPLPGRRTVVLSRSAFQFPGVETRPSLADMDPTREGSDVYISGGGEIYAAALPLCRDLFLTRVKRTVEGDVLFPAFEHWFPSMELVRETPEFDIVHYWRSC